MAISQVEKLKASMVSAEHVIQFKLDYSHSFVKVLEEMRLIQNKIGQERMYWGDFLHGTKVKNSRFVQDVNKFFEEQDSKLQAILNTRQESVEQPQHGIQYAQSEDLVNPLEPLIKSEAKVERQRSSCEKVMNRNIADFIKELVVDKKTQTFDSMEDFEEKVLDHMNLLAKISTIDGESYHVA